MTDESQSMPTHRGGSATLMAFTPLFQFGIEESIKNAIIDFLQDVISGIIRGPINFFSNLIKELLFFPRPRAIDTLEGIQGDAMFLFGGLLLIGWLTFFLNMQVFPYKTDSDPYRLLERSFAGVVMVIAGPLLLDYGVILTNQIGNFLYPNDLGTQILSILADTPSGSIAALVALVLLGSTLVFVVAAFFIVLAIRMFLVYVVFALLPLFAAFWIFDSGVGKYGKKAADMFFEATGMILVAGILISGILQVGVAVAQVGADAISAGAAGDGCVNGMSIAGHCILNWGQLLSFIGVGGAMTVSTTVAIMGVGSLFGSGGVGSVAGGAVAGAAASSVGKAKSKLGSGSSSQDAAGGDDAPAPNDTGSGASGRQFEPANRGATPATDGSGQPTSRTGSSGSSSRATTAGALGGAATGGVSSTGQPGGTGDSQPDQDQGQQSLFDKAVGAVDAGATVGGAVGKVDPVMGAATGLAAAGYKFSQEGGFQDFEQAASSSYQTGKQTLSKAQNVYDNVSPFGGDQSSSDGGGRIGHQSENNANEEQVSFK